MSYGTSLSDAYRQADNTALSEAEAKAIETARLRGHQWTIRRSEKWQRYCLKSPGFTQ
jgi:hypothetical protein